MFRVTVEGLKLYKYYALNVKSEHKSAMKNVMELLIQGHGWKKDVILGGTELLGTSVS